MMPTGRRRLTAHLVRFTRSAKLAPVAFLSVACGSDPASPPGGAPADAGSDALVEAGPDASADPSFNVDGQDVDATNGEPSLDITGSWIYFDGGQPWVRALFYGAWPPATTLYSWSCQIFLSTANAPVATYTVRSLNGTQTDYAEGIDKTKVSFAAESTGFRVLFADTSIQFDRYALQCIAQKTKSSEQAQDDSGSFTVKTKETRAFGP